MSITVNKFGTLPDGSIASVYRIQAATGACVDITDYGGAVMRLFVPDREGHLGDVVCGYDSLDSYVRADGYQGALVGRVGNRIAGGRFTLDGRQYTLYRNNGENSLHGGKVGFSHRLWKTEMGQNDDSLTLTLTSPDGDEGYPGCMDVRVKYSFVTRGEDVALVIEYFAVSDKKTLINLTNHTYFNLGGYDAGDVYDHILSIDADSYLPTDDALIPTGEIKAARGAFDFTERPIGRDIDSSDPDIRSAGGYDHCFVFNGGRTSEPGARCELYCPRTGRHMEVFTDRPCVQCYTANFMNNAEFPLKGGVPQQRRHAVCLETQNAPDSIHHPEFVFSDAVLEAGQPFHSVTEYRFGVRY